VDMVIHLKMRLPAVLSILFVIFIYGALYVFMRSNNESRTIVYCVYPPSYASVIRQDNNEFVFSSHDDKVFGVITVFAGMEEYSYQVAVRKSVDCKQWKKPSPLISDIHVEEVDFSRWYGYLVWTKDKKLHSLEYLIISKENGLPIEVRCLDFRLIPTLRDDIEAMMATMIIEHSSDQNAWKEKRNYGQHAGRQNMNEDSVDSGYRKEVEKAAQSGIPVVIRLDFADDSIFSSIVKAISKPAKGLLNSSTLTFDVCCLQYKEYEGTSVEHLVKLLSASFKPAVIYVIDHVTITHADHPILVVDLVDESGRTFRVIPSTFWNVESNLALSNMDFEEFADSVDEHGIFRGFEK